MGRDKIPFHFSSLGRSHGAPSPQGQRDTDMGAELPLTVGVRSWHFELQQRRVLCVPRSDLKSLFLSSSLDRAPLALVSHRSAKEFRPATYKLRDLRQVIGPLSLGFSDSNVRPAGPQGAKGLPAEHTPLLINIRERTSRQRCQELG